MQITVNRIRGAYPTDAKIRLEQIIQQMDETCKHQKLHLVASAANLQMRDIPNKRPNDKNAHALMYAHVQ